MGQDIKSKDWHLYCRLAMGQRYFTAGLLHHDSASVNTCRKQNIGPKISTSEGVHCRKNLKVMDEMEQTLIKYVVKGRSWFTMRSHTDLVSSWWQKVTFSIRSHSCMCKYHRRAAALACGAMSCCEQSEGKIRGELEPTVLIQQHWWIHLYAAGLAAE